MFTLYWYYKTRTAIPASRTLTQLHPLNKTAVHSYRPPPTLPLCQSLLINPQNESQLLQDHHSLMSSIIYYGQNYSDYQSHATQRQC